MNLTHNTILITGGSGGIGLALTERLHAAGNTMLICGRDEAKLRAVAERLPGLRTLVCDVGRAEERVRLFEWATAECPALNVLVNNAGIQRLVDLHAAPVDWAVRAAEIAINFEAPVHLCQLFSGHLAGQTAPAILNVSSGLGFVPLASVPIYSATKAAMHSFTQSLRWQLADSGITVVEIIPPAVHTDLGETDHSFGMPLDAYADDVLRQLATDATEVATGFAAQAHRASREQLDTLFTGLNKR